jgi:peptidoglycan/LPS O-acetylase OafA/YrhL
MIVFLSHGENQVAIYFKSFENKVIQLGGVALNHIFLGPGAVVAFFIISGFVIHYPFKDRPLNIKQFLVRRWIRIVLPLLAALALASYLDGVWMIPIWSLYCELIYYTIYPLLRRLPVSWKIQFVISFVIAAVLMFTLATDELQSLLTQSNVKYTGSYAALGDWLTWLIGLPCWLIGVLIAENVDQIKWNVSTMKIILIRGAMLVVAAIVVGLKAHWYMSYLFTLNFIAPLVGYWILSEIVYFRHNKPWAWLEYGGKFSYSLYLLHVFVWNYIGLAFAVSLSTYPIIIILTVLMAWIFYVLVEAPSHKLSRYLANKV